MNILVNTPETKICLPLLHRSKSLPVATIRALDKYTQNMKAGCAVNLPTVSIVSSKQIKKPSKKRVLFIILEHSGGIIETNPRLPAFSLVSYLL